MLQDCDTKRYSQILKDTKPGGIFVVWFREGSPRNDCEAKVLTAALDRVCKTGAQVTMVVYSFVDLQGRALDYKTKARAWASPVGSSEGLCADALLPDGLKYYPLQQRDDKGEPYWYLPTPEGIAPIIIELNPPKRG